MLFQQLLGVLVAAGFGAVAEAKCNGDLQIDNFANFASLTNSQNSPASDDQSMASISAANNVLKFTPRDGNSYFYESFPCVQAKSQGYGGLQFTITYPAGTDFTLEAQTRTSCNAANYTSEWFTISGLSGTQQVVTLDLNVYETSNLDAITGFVFASFSKVGAYTLSDLRFVCRNLEAPSRREPPALLPNSHNVPATQPQDVPGLFQKKRSQHAASPLPVGPLALIPSSTILFSRPPPTPLSSVFSLAAAAPSAVPAITTSARSTIITATTYLPKPTSAAACRDLLIDDWESQSRLTFLYYNSMKQPSSDDNTMKSIVVNNDNTVTITPASTDSYFYSQMACIDTVGVYGGISLKVRAAPGTTFAIQLASPATCGSSNFTQTQTLSTTDLGWTFDGTMRVYAIPLAKFAGAVDLTKLSMIYFSSLSNVVTFGPMGFYCGEQPAGLQPPPHMVNAQNQYNVPAPASTEGSLLIDDFGDPSSNALNQWHGCDEDCVTAAFGDHAVTLQTNNSDLAWYSQLADNCADITAFNTSYLHIPYSGSNKFTISLQQANAACNPNVSPFPETWDSLEAARYATDTDIYIPIAHFNIDLRRASTFAFKGFYTTAPTTLHKIEIVPAVPAGFTMPNKLPSGNLVFACKRPNSFAFAIDDGDPTLAQEVMEIVKSENIVVTFFTVGLPLEDPSTNLSTVYLDMQARGHQIAMHSFTHPKMEGLADYAAIDWEYNNDITAVSRTFNNFHTPYFRPPFGTEGARMRQRLALALNITDPYIVMWSIDVEDWKWGLSSTPEKQLDAFKRDLGNGGNLVVMHYLYPNTVKYLRQFIRLAKATGKQMMRVDQCMMDPRAPPLP
ncbi:Glycoside hydrolase/deacetylase, beta/alpha-barrel [Niveomyces insectorum RCEF 264]|uniref:Glycoside hydrolase/deacetylase, beta/alpha-barrel n=1 Tax=Niveomyces insectorum RCEF 264 TaxID=1081102 RepID=A0A162MQ40_9HYPO|nr:Glycoside hydrolase/deacetylase, beta/alpha-barrel [Niveomyces insectorum RCEF 264]